MSNIEKDKKVNSRKSLDNSKDEESESPELKGKSPSKPDIDFENPSTLKNVEEIMDKFETVLQILFETTKTTDLEREQFEEQ